MSSGDPTGDSRPSDSLSELDEIIAEYIRAEEAGEPPDREEFLSRCEEFRSELEEFFDNRDHIQQIALSSRPANDHPEYVGPYRVLEVLGEGGMGVVYIAEQKAPVRRRVALKLIKIGMDTKGVVARFEAERQALAVMDHPNIARIYDAGATDDGRPYFVMEHVRGLPLEEYFQRSKLTVKDRLDVFLQIPIQYLWD